MRPPLNTMNRRDVLRVLHYIVPIYNLDNIFSMFFECISLQCSCSAMLTLLLKCACKNNAKQKHLECKKGRGQSEAALQIAMCDQKL